MYEYEQVTRPRGGAAKWICALLLLLALGLVIAAKTAGAYLAVAQLLAVGAVTAAVAVAVRYLLCSYAYRTEYRTRTEGDAPAAAPDDPAAYDFVITEHRGKRRTVRVRLSSGQCVKFVTSPEEVATVRGNASYSRYFYVQDAFATGVCVIVARDGDDDVAVFFAPDDTLRDILAHLVK